MNKFIITLKGSRGNMSKKKNKGRKLVIFYPDDEVSVHITKEIFHYSMCTKLHPHGDGPFQILAHNNNNAYKQETLE